MHANAAPVGPAGADSSSLAGPSGALREVAGTGFRLCVHDSPVAAEAPWRVLEESAVLTPYQRYDWIRALLEARPLAGERCAVAVVHDAGGPAALFPFAVGPTLGVRAARIIGSDIGNADWLPVRRDVAPRLTPETLRALFAEAGRQAGGIDVVVLANQPQSWQGLASPLMGLPHQPAPDHLYLAPVTPDGTGHLSHKFLRNIQRGRRRLEEELGPVMLRRADSAAEIAAVHAAFLEQRNARFAQMGIRNVFADAWFVDFFRRAAIGGLGQKGPALRLHALYAGTEIVATACGAYCGTHYSQYINSAASGPAARFSLIGILMHALVAELAADGIASTDMGLGDFPYKTDWTAQQEVYDSAIGLTMAGRVAARAILASRALKRTIKRNPNLFGAFKRLRAAALRVRRAKPDPT